MTSIAADRLILALGLFAALWLVLAVWALVRGLSMQRNAAFVATQTERLGALLEAAPAVPVLVRADWRIEAPGKLAALLGLDDVPRSFDDLHSLSGGLDAPQHDSLKKAVLGAQRGGKPFVLSITADGSARTLLVRGAPAAGTLGAPGSVLMWLFDATESESERIALQSERDEAMAAFEALSGLIEAAPFPMWFRDRSLKLALVNGAYVRAAEAPSADAVIRDNIELVEPVADVSALAAARAALTSGQAGQRTVPVTVAGARRMMRVVDVALGDIGVAGYAIDVAELEAERAENRRFVTTQRDLLDRLSAAVAQFGPDRSLVFANQPFRRLFAMEPQAVAERPEFVRVLDHARDQGRVPEVRDFPEWRSERGGWFTLAEAVEEEWLLRDGMHLRVVAQPTPDGGLMLIVEDRTEQAQLATTRDTLLRVRTATFDNLFEAVAVFAPDGRLHLWNQRFRKLWAADEGALARHPRVDALMEALSDRLEKPQQNTIITQIVRNATVERQHRGGAIRFKDGRHFDFASIPLPDGNALFIMIDVSASRQMEAALRDRNEALEAADKVKTAFLSRMSYELRTPLTSIGGFAEMLAGGYAGALPDAAGTYVTAILDSVGVLGRHIDNVLDLAQGEAGTLAIDHAPVAVTALVDEAVARAKPHADAESVTLVAERADELGNVSGDARRLGQILDQLIDNAIRYTGEARAKGGRILVFAEGDKAEVRLIVSDNGPGLPDAVSAVAEGRIGGTALGGIGLALTRQLVEAHGGRMEAMSEKGQGTLVRITLPRG